MPAFSAAQTPFFTNNIQGELLALGYNVWFKIKFGACHVFTKQSVSLDAGRTVLLLEALVSVPDFKIRQKSFWMRNRVGIWPALIGMLFIGICLSLIFSCHHQIIQQTAALRKKLRIFLLIHVRTTLYSMLIIFWWLTRVQWPEDILINYGENVCLLYMKLSRLIHPKFCQTYKVGHLKLKVYKNRFYFAYNVITHVPKYRLSKPFLW